MRKLKLFFACLLMAVFSIGQVWGASPATFSYGTLSAHSPLSTQSDNPVTLTWDKGTNTSNSPQHNKSGYAQLYANNKVTVSISSGYEITSVTFTFNTAKSLTITTDAPDNSYSSYVFTPLDANKNASACTWVTFLNSEAAQAKINSISVAYQATGGSTPDPSYTITAQSNNTEYGTVSLSGTVITGAPKAGYRYADPAYTVDPANSAEVSQDGNAFTVTPSANTTVTINFEAIPQYTVTWNNNGVTSTSQVYEGAKPEFPATPAACDATSTTFIGWATAPWDGKLADLSEKTVYTSADAMPAVSGAVTYYAVFAKVAGESGWIETAIGNLGASDIFVFTDGTYAMTNNNGTSSAPATSAVTIAAGKITSAVADNLKWNISGNATDGYTFYPNGSTTTWLYCNTTASSSSNNCMRVGTGDRKVFKVNASGYLVTNDTYTARYLSRYDESSTPKDFRGYVNTNTNPVQPKCYKYSAGTASDYMTTCCTKYNVNIAAGIENGSVSADPASACEGATVTLTFTPAGGYHLDSWSLNGTAQDVNENTFPMPAAAATVSATFAHDDCANLAAPTLDEITKTYNSATIAWNEVTDAEEYAVSVVNHATSESVFAGNVDALSKALADLEPETQYDYSIMAVGDGTIKCADGNGVLAGNFTTEPLPTAHLTLIDPSGTHASSGDYAILTPFNLPTTAATCSKTFVGWDSDANCATAPTYAKGAEFTFANTTGVTLYAVYATVASTTAEFNAGEYATTNSWVDATAYSGFTIDGVTFTANGGGNNGKYYTSDATWRLYNGGSVSLSATGNISSVSSNPSLTFTIDGTSASCSFTATTKIKSITVTYEGAYSNYSTTCVAAPEAIVDPKEVNAPAAGVANGIIEAAYDNVNEEEVGVSLWNNQACTEAFNGGWLTASINGDKNIAYTIAENTSYNDARTAYIKLTAPETTGATAPAVVIIPVSQAKKAAVFSSLEELVAADVNANTNVTVEFSNVVIKDIYYYNSNRRGLTFNIQKDNEDIKIYYNADVPAEWVAGGKVSGTLTACPWKIYSGAWQLAPASGWQWAWTEQDQKGLVYTAPAEVSTVVVSGSPSKTTYVDGEKLNPDGLSVRVNYTDETYEDNPVGVTFSEVVLHEGDTEAEITATYGTTTSDAYTVTDLTVGAVQPMSIADFIAAGGARCYLEGIVSNYTNKTKGYFDLTDASGTIYIYGCDEPSEFAEDDKIRVLAEEYLYYQSTTHEAKNVVFVSKVSPVTITITSASTVEKGNTLNLTATTDPEGAVEHISYSIKQDENKDNVSLSGAVLTGVEIGEATIIASVPDGEGYIANSVEFTVEVIAAVVHASITYEENGGDEVADVDDATNLPDPLPVPTRDGYTFVGWFTDNNTFENAVVAGAALDGDITLYAKWHEIPVWAYTYTSNVTLSDATASTVVIGEDSFDAMKAGTNSATGSVNVTVPAQTTKLHFHASGWNGKDVTLNITAPSGITVTPASVNLIADEGVSGDGTTYTLVNDPKTQAYFVVELSGNTDAFTLNIANTAGKKQFVLFGVNAEYPEITLSPATSFDFGSVVTMQSKEQVFTITANNVTGTLSAEITDDASSKFSVGSISNNEVTVTFEPGEVTEGTFTAKLQVSASNASAMVSLSGTAVSLPAAALSFPEDSYNANLGSDFVEPILTTDPEGIAVTYSSSVPGVATVDEATGVITLVGEGTTVITATFDGNDNYSPNTATYTLNVADPNKDVLTAEKIAVSGSYANWSDKTFGSGIKYAGNSTTGTSGNAGAIQMRVSSGTQEKSGIVTTTAIGYLKSISATRKSGSNYLDVYAKGSAYESAADLYDNEKQGTLIGTINNDAMVFDGTKSYADNYKYIGIRSHSGAVYYEDITITWEPAVFASFDVTYQAGEVSADPVVESIEEGSIISLAPANTFTAPEGKIFAGWLLEGEQNIREAGSKYTVTAAATFTAQWVSVYTITYTAGDGTGDDVIVPNVQAGDYELADNTFTAPENMEFAGWKLNNAGETLAAGANYNVSGNASFTAQWSIVKQAADLAYATTSYTIIRGREFTAPTLTNEHNVEVIYSGNNDAVATVDAATGAITMQGGIGTVTVTATFEGNDYYYAAEASYTLKVLDANLAGGWERLTASSALINGMKVIIAEHVIIAEPVTTATTLKTMGAQNTNNRAEVTSALDTDDKLVSGEGTAIFTLVKVGESTYAFKTADNKYLYAASSGSNHLKSQAKIDGNATWTISLSADGKATITAQGENTRNLMRYNSSNGIFSCYTGNQKDIALYSKTVGISSGETDASTLDDYADVVVAEGATLVIDQAASNKPLGQITGNVDVQAPLTAEAVHLGTTNTMTVSSSVNVPSFSISVQLGGAGQATNVNVTGTGSIAAPEGYVDMALTDNGRGGAGQWHSFTVPFPVDALNGIYNAETGDKLINEKNYAIMDYHSDIRANGEYGWKKYRGILQPGTFYLITVDGSCPNLRFMKTQGSNYVAANNIALTYQSGTGADTDYGWCGVGNQNMFGGYVNFTVQILNSTGTAYDDVDPNAQSFSACIPFFIQVTQNETLVMSTTNPSAAPARVHTDEIKNQRIYFGNENFTDRLTVSASEDALNQYEIGKDLLKMTVSNTPTVPQIFGSAYGNKLCRVNAPMANDQAEVALDLYAPAAGEYTISASENENATVYLVCNGSIIWNLSSGAYTAEFAKGNNAGYSIRILKTPQVTTGIDNTGLLNGANGVQKVVIDNHVYILRNEQMYNVNGQVVK